MWRLDHVKVSLSSKIKTEMEWQSDFKHNYIINKKNSRTRPESGWRSKAGSSYSSHRFYWQRRQDIAAGKYQKRGILAKLVLCSEVFPSLPRSWHHLCLEKYQKWGILAKLVLCSEVCLSFPRSWHHPCLELLSRATAAVSFGHQFITAFSYKAMKLVW